jgi:phospholipase/carboxylesterase
MTIDLLRCVEIEPDRPARAAVIWLHGLGADGHDFEPVVPELGLSPELAVRFVFPHAPSIPVTINGGYVMPAWYDILGIDLDSRADSAGILRSAERVRALLERERERGIESERIVLAGFSQGGAIALYLALSMEESLAGVMALSTYLPLDPTAKDRSHSPRTLEVFQAHGTADPMIPPGLGMLARERLLELGCHVEWHTYPMAHQVCALEIEHIGHWLSKRLAL